MHINFKTINVRFENAVFPNIILLTKLNSSLFGLFRKGIKSRFAVVVRKNSLIDLFLCQMRVWGAIIKMHLIERVHAVSGTDSDRKE